ncbi:hypothetical protein Fmac_012853 [Flemingia macrophylla]|uniref:EF-hand domain-containing protein n=1 Tax=Flemingia macrophylla TaxID=520843 RepID=A0ABD1MRG9_9FABA
MDLSTLLLVVLFIAGLINIIFYVPTNKITACLQILFPNNKARKLHMAASPSSPTANVDKDIQKRKGELRKVFSTFDKNGDGFITKEELRESLRNIRIFMTDKEVDDVVAKYDSNGDGLLDFQEFCLLTSECVGASGEEREEKEGEEVNLKEAFDVFDKDNDGLISVEELALVLTSLGLREGMKIEECKEMINKVDMDGDGMVNFHEFKKMMMSANGNLVFPA